MINDEIWPWPKIVQGQLRIIIWTNYDGLDSSVINTKFLRNRPIGSRRDDFLGVLCHIWSWRSSWSCDLDPANKVIIWTNYDWPEPKILHIKFHCNQPIASGEEFWIFFFVISIYMSRQPSWSGDQTYVNKFSFPCSVEFSYEIWFQLVQ